MRWEKGSPDHSILKSASNYENNSFSTLNENVSFMPIELHWLTNLIQELQKKNVHYESPASYVMFPWVQTL